MKIFKIECVLVLVFFCLSFHFLIPAFAQSPEPQSQTQRQWDAYQAQVGFSKERHAVQMSSVEGQFPQGVVQETYLWNRGKNSIILRTLVLQGFSRLNFVGLSGEPASTYFSSWSRAIDVKTLYQAKDKLERLQLKYSETERNQHLGADYLREAATLLASILKVESGTEMVSDTGLYSISLNALRDQLIGSIRSWVSRAESNKRKFVYNAFWQRAGELDILVSSWKTLVQPRKLFVRSKLNSNEWWESFLSAQPTTYSNLTILVCKDYF